MSCLGAIFDVLSGPSHLLKTVDFFFNPILAMPGFWVHMVPQAPTPPLIEYLRFPIGPQQKSQPMQIHY